MMLITLLLLLLQLVTWLKGLAQMKPAGPKGASMVVSLSVRATQTCATVTSRGPLIQKSLSPHSPILEVL